MQARLIPIDAVSGGDTEAWQDLAENAAEPNPFFDPTFVQLAAKHLDARRLSLLVIEDGGSWRACLPVRKRGWGSMAALQGWRNPYVYLGTPLVDVRKPEAAKELVNVLGERQAVVFGVDKLNVGGAIASKMIEAMKETHCPIALRTDHERAALGRASVEDCLTLSSREQSEARRRQRKLEKELGAPVTVEDRSQDPQAPAEFLRLEGSGWKGRRGTALASKSGHADFFLALCDSFAAKGGLQLLRLGSERDTVAMSCNLTAGNVLFCFKLAYDERFRRSAPGVQLVRANVEVFRDERTETLMDSCADPGNELLNKAWPDRLKLSTMVASSPTLTGSISRWSVRRLSDIRQSPLAGALRTW